MLANHWRVSESLTLHTHANRASFPPVQVESVGSYTPAGAACVPARLRAGDELFWCDACWADWTVPGVFFRCVPSYWLLVNCQFSLPTFITIISSLTHIQYKEEAACMGQHGLDPWFHVVHGFISHTLIMYPIKYPIFNLIKFKTFCKFCKCNKICHFLKNVFCKRKGTRFQFIFFAPFFILFM